LFVLIRDVHRVFTCARENRNEYAFRQESARIHALQFRHPARLPAISAGIAIEIGKTVKPGVEVELVMDWPGLYHGRQRMRLFVWGEVLRSCPAKTAAQAVA
jgi:hypothetical protein